MSRRCTVCEHSDVQEINRRLVSGDSIAGIARDSAVSEDALRRHKEGHISKTLAASPSAKEMTDADRLFAEIETVRTRALSLLDKAEDARSTKIYGPPSAYLKEFREYIRLMAELSGQLASQPQINILINPEWIQLRTVITNALEPYPDAKQAVLNAIQ